MSIFALAALLAFPCLAVLWLFLCDRLGMVRDEPLIERRETLLPMRRRRRSSGSAPSARARAQSDGIARGIGPAS